jgi:hypothetical protein
VIRCLPPERLEIHIEVTGETERTFVLTALGQRLGASLNAIRDRLAGPDGGHGQQAVV